MTMYPPVLCYIIRKGADMAIGESGRIVIETSGVTSPNMLKNGINLKDCFLHEVGRYLDDTSQQVPLFPEDDEDRRGS
jgi:hypothetical protein